MPTQERVSDLATELVARRGYDLESVQILPAGKDTTLRILVDADGGVDLDAIAELSNEISAALDETDVMGAAPYTLEVTTPGVDRPLTQERHWRRARGRKVRVSLADGRSIHGRVGALDAGAVTLVVPGRREPVVVSVPLADVRTAVVQVEFSAPNPRELQLAGGVAAGRPAPGDRAEEHA
ncbi:MAG TPA: ribosome maturation factor RimP [Aldersonia sp.]